MTTTTTTTNIIATRAAAVAAKDHAKIRECDRIYVAEALESIRVARAEVAAKIAASRAVAPAAEVAPQPAADPIALLLAGNSLGVSSCGTLHSRWSNGAAQCCAGGRLVVMTRIATAERAKRAPLCERCFPNGLDR